MITCSKSRRAKYIDRPGPPYPAQNCKDIVKIGNDRKKYKSVPNKKGVYQWKKIAKKSKSTKRKH